MAAINKNFVIKNGIEVANNLIYAESNTHPKVGIGTTIPGHTLDVRGGIGATNISVGQTISANSGIFTAISFGNASINNLNVSGIVTTNNLNILGIATAVGFSATVGIATVFSSTWSTVGASVTFFSGIGTNLRISGISTLSNIRNTTLINQSIESISIASTWGQVGLGLTFYSGIGTNLNISGLGTITTLNSTDISAVASRSTWGQVGLGFTATTGIITNFSAGLGTITQLIGGSVRLSGVTTTGNLFVSGISTLGTISINSGIITANSGIVTYYGSGQNLTGLVTSISAGSGILVSQSQGQVTVSATSSFAGIGIQSTGTNVSFGITTLDFRGSSVQSVVGNSLTGISTITIQAGAAAPAGSNTQIQYNNAGVTGASANLTFDGNNLYVAGIITASNGNYSGIVTATDFNSTSDLHFKENVSIIENPLSILSEINGVRFTWKETQRQSMGVIAQDVEKVAAELVSSGETKSVNYNGLIAILIECIKELKNDVDLLKKGMTK